LIPVERERPDIARRRRWWLRWQLGVDPSRLVFIDETALRTDMTRLRGRALGTTGVQCSMVMEGAMNAEAFALFVKQVLVPTLTPGQIVVLDNLASHKGRNVKRMIRQAGCRLVFLPPYGYDLNPIELAFSKLKQLVRGAAARTVNALWDAAGRVANAITPSDAAGFFTACGYHSIATHESAPL